MNLFKPEIAKAIADQEKNDAGDRAANQPFLELFFMRNYDGYGGALFDS